MTGREKHIQIAIVSDDRAVATTFKAFCGAFCAAEELHCRCNVFSGIASFAASLYAELYTVVFSSFTEEEDLARLRGAAPRAGVVLISDDAAAAVRGYAIEACHILPRRPDFAQFDAACRHACRRARAEKRGSVLLKEGNWCRRICIDDVQFVEVNGRFLLFHLTDGVVTVHGQLCHIENDLGRAGFYRCSAKYMVNLRHIECYDGSSVYVGESKIPVSRRKKEDFFGQLGGVVRRGLPL